MSDIVNNTPYTTEQLTYITDLRSELEDLLQESGLDPEAFFTNLDGDLTLDLKDNPAYEKYLLLAFQELCYIRMGGEEDLVSIYGDTDIDWSSFESMQETMDAELYEFLDELIQDNPEFLALFATLNEGTVEGNEVLQALNGELAALNTASDSEEFEFSQEAYSQLVSSYGIEGLDGLANYESAIRQGQASIMLEIMENDEATAQILEDYAAGLITADEMSAMMDQKSMNRETLMVEYQNMEMTLNTFAQMMTSIVDSMFETQKQVAAGMG